MYIDIHYCYPLKLIKWNISGNSTTLNILKEGVQINL